MTGHRKKSKFTVYLDPDVTQALADFAARRDQSQSMIAEAAIASFLSPDDAERRVDDEIGPPVSGKLHPVVGHLFAEE